MAVPARLLIETRRDQMFPVLEASEIERLHRFCGPRSYPATEATPTAGAANPGLNVILSGSADIIQHGPDDEGETIITLGPGGFTGELAHLSGRPGLVDVRARGAVEALLI